MKIGILSMNYTKNYGGIMQTYGLYKYLTNIGHEVTIINYKNSGKKNFLNYLTKVVTLIQSQFNNKLVSPKRNPVELTQRYLENFVEFRKWINYTPLLDENSLSVICQQFDTVIVGSDQIWNDINSNVLAFYFDWHFNGKKIAYAACTIFKKSPFLLRFKIKRLLRNFDLITVRDRNTSNFVLSNGIKRPKIVVDPTMLYSYKEFVGNNPIEVPYILTYILGSEINGGLNNALTVIKRYVGNIKVVSVVIPCESTISKKYSDIFLDEVSPVDWVNLFANASFVLTDSFHGIIFSMKFNKQFIAYFKDKTRASRLLDLTERYSLKNIIDNVNDIENVFNQGVIDYNVVSKLISENTLYSKELISKELA